MSACYKCGGTGKVKCDKCDGTGKIRNTSYIAILSEVSGLANDWEKCYRCNGAGKKKCGRCRGSGKSPDD